MFYLLILGSMLLNTRVIYVIPTTNYRSSHRRCSVKQGVLKDNFLQNTSGWPLLELTLQKHYSWYRRFHIHWLSFFLNILFVLTHNFRIQEMCHKKIGCQIYLLWWLTPRQTRSRYSRKKTYACPSHVFQGH